ncbi:MFS transporter [Craurococcus roseus]|uniref:MFS transporter n=1 Tax=Craurococcus roseus TaxID=77585 RepID=A0ABN1F3L2_9PROT
MPDSERPPPSQPVLSAPPVGLFALAGFATGSGMRLLDPLLPLLAREFGVTVSAVAGLVAGFVVAYGLVQIGAGPLGDRFGKARVACGALLLYGLCLLGSAAASGLPMLVALRAASGFFAGAVIPLLMAELGDRVPYAERQGVLGRFMTGMVMAQLLAGPAAGVLAELADWRLPFLLLGLFALAVGGALARRLHAKRPDAAGTAARGGGRGFGYAALLRRPAGRRLMGVAFLNGFFLFGGAFAFSGAFLVEELGRNAAEAGAVVACFGLGAFAYTRLARLLVRRLGERRLLLAGGVGLSAGLGALALAGGWAQVAALQAVLGLAFYMFHGVLQVRATEALPEARGTAVGAFALALFLGQGAGSLAFGLGLSTVGYRGAFAAAAAGVLALALWARRGMR